MPRIIGGFLRFGRGGPVDPGFGGGIGAARPDQGLPEGEGPVDPGYGIGIEHPDQGLPTPPPGVWPPPSASHPIVPVPPGGSVPPGTIWPSPGVPPHPSHGLPPSPGHPDQGLPPSPGHPDQGLPSQTFWMICYCPSLGWKYVAVDPSLSVGYPLPPAPEPK